MIETLESFGKFGIAIADEAYYLKNSNAKRTELILPLIQSCKRCILLAGTPALARPKEIFNLLHIIRPDIFSTFKDFGKRYCSPKHNKWSMGLDYTGSSNLKELHYILTHSVMIRRLKQDVLTELPMKLRQKIQVETNPEYVELIQEALKGDKSDGTGVSNRLTLILKKLMSSEWVQDNEQFEENAKRIEKEEEMKFPQFFECYKYTGLAKLAGIKKYLKETLEKEVKILVFAHHTEVLDGIEEEIAVMGIKSIRIDGSVPPKRRFDLVKAFQEDDDVKVAILSLTAAGIGLTLTAATRVVFAEVTYQIII